MPKEKAEKRIVAARLAGPGPGVYGLPNLTGFVDHDVTKDKRPAYSFGKRYVYTEKYHSPGPAYFVKSGLTHKGVDGIPAYTARIRFNDQGIFRTPAPNAYENEKCHPQGEKIAPMYTMRSRTHYRKSDPNPAPNRYTLPRVIGPDQAYKRSGAAYTMRQHLKTGHFAEDYVHSPGAAGYGSTKINAYRPKLPEYTMREKVALQGADTNKPGPDAHKREDVTVNMPRAPQFSMGVKHTDFETLLFVEP